VNQDCGEFDDGSVLLLIGLGALCVTVQYGTFVKNFNFLQKGAEPPFFSKNQKVLREEGFPHPEVPPKGGYGGTCQN